MHVLIIGRGALGQAISQELMAEDHIVFMDRDLNNIPQNHYDVIIDCSHPDNLQDLCAFAQANKLPVVIATTGLSDEQFEYIDALAQKVPVLYSANFSLGVVLMNKIVNQVTQVLHTTFDIEILEKHHRNKLDSPSGTVNMLLSAVQSALSTPYDVNHGRQGFKKRKSTEIGVHSLRGGSFHGEHQVIFAGEDEVFTISHQAGSKRVFARGAVLGTTWLLNQPAGRYSMEDLLAI